MYLDPGTAKLVLLPAGADTALGVGIERWQLGAVPSLQSPNPAARLAYRLYEQPGFRDGLRNEMLRFISDVWDPAAMSAELDKIASLVRSVGLSGSREEADLAAFEAAVADRRAFIETRAAYVAAQLG